MDRPIQTLLDDITNYNQPSVSLSTDPISLHLVISRTIFTSEIKRVKILKGTDVTC